jgi:hypothetical protein
MKGARGLLRQLRIRANALIKLNKDGAQLINFGAAFLFELGHFLYSRDRRSVMPLSYRF